ncbi:fused signal recognition particle receptor [Methylohalomonas lacus]|uniref:Signal recognition particle receptor FtsY n=1 Tax=Methylohalomonas lacus TaxID=398773 RepID=A0AAE3HK81_9GAMM|nr:signal recognition particle-docking protein FtsY [Methylohalomonas lacus]MCS3903305.1 fused signal recognition particle receptor [Methylohalomonas lacus]
MFSKGSKQSNDAPPAAAEKSGGLLKSLKRGLSKTRDLLLTDVGDLVPRGGKIDEAALEELENRLLQADVGIDATSAILDNLRERARKAGDGDPGDLLRAAMLDILAPVAQPLDVSTANKPFVIMAVGVNGVGKTTTLGKLGAHLRDSHHKVLLAAGDTFRAAAIEQLQEWGERTGLPVIAQSHGSDAASVVFDAIHSGRARGSDVVLADTAGRLHTKDYLMTELKKVRRVIDKIEPRPDYEVLLVIDASTGQNALVQAKEFHQAIGLTGIVLTKLDGTARGGIVFALAQNLGLPIRYIGVGERIEDLRPFDAESFVDALLAQ